MEISINQNGWAVTWLEDIATRITKGGTPTTYGYSFQTSGINFLKVENISDGRVNLKSITDFIGEEAHKFQLKSQLSVNDILFSIAGTIGETCVIREEYLPANTNQALAIIKGTDVAIIPKLLQLQLEAFVAKVKMKARGGAMNNVSLEDLKNLLVYIPPVPEQHRIVSKIEELFSSLDKGIDSLKTAEQQLKVYRQAVLKWAFEGRLTNKEVIEGELPKGWKKLTLGDIANRNSQKALPREKPDAKFIGMDCIEPNTLKPFKFYEFKEFKSAGNLFRKNQVLYGRMRPYLNKVYKAEIDGACSGEFIVLDCLNDFNPDLLKYILHHRDFVSFANHKTSGDRPRISFEEISDYPVNVCTPEEQQRIVSEIESRLSVCDKIEESITTSLQQAEALRQSILKKAFEGKLAEQDPNDEPASKLLERIKSEREKNKPVKKVKPKKQKIANG